MYVGVIGSTNINPNMLCCPGTAQGRRQDQQQEVLGHNGCLGKGGLISAEELEEASRKRRYLI